MTAADPWNTGLTGAAGTVYLLHFDPAVQARTALHRLD
jgi:hypothetical protein